MVVIEDILSEVKKYPLLSHSAAKLLEVVGDEDHALEDVVRIVECDSVLTSHVLKTVNSAAFGLLQPCASVVQAVAYLGDRMIVGIAIDSCAPQLFRNTLDGYDSVRGSLWMHSLKTAIASRELAGYCKKVVVPNVAFTAGLLHDIGKSVLSEFLVDYTQQIVEKIDASLLMDFVQGEREYLGTDHCAVGGALARHWNLPNELILPIRHHHVPMEADEEFRDLVFVVHLGDMIAMMGGTGAGVDSMRYNLDEGYIEYVKVSKETLAEIMLKIGDEFERAKSLIFTD